MKIKKLIIFLGLSVLFFFLISCVTTGGERGIHKPLWVDNYPADDAYFIGIGSSSTGNKAEDNEKARARALSNVAAAISTKIQSDTTFKEREDSTGESSRSAEQVINEVVSQNLQMVETVDTYYSADSGYWYYMRLNKAKWAALQEREIADLEKRTKDLIIPVLNSSSKSIAEKLAVLWTGWDIIASSPYPGMIKTTLNGESGSLIDLVEKQIGNLVNSMSIKIKPSIIESEVGRPAGITITVDSDLPFSTGPMRVDIAAKSNENRPLLSVVTDQRGIYSEDVDFSDFALGKSYLVARLDLFEFGIDEERVNTELIIPQKDFMLDVQQLKAGLDLNVEGDVEDEIEIGRLYGTVKALFTKTLPIKITETGGDKTFTFEFDIHYRSAPKNDYGFIIVYVKANISVLRRSKSIYTYETEEFKGGGLNWSQANSKATDKLFETLEEDDEFTEGVKEVFSFD